MAKPNIIIIVPDDLGYNDPMPLMNSLAQTKFTQFYGAPVCTPARAALMTGRYAWRMGLQRIIMPWSEGHLPLEVSTLPELLKEQGYHTSIVGKWHLGHSVKEALPLSRGFDNHYGSYVGNMDYYKHTNRGVHDFWENGDPCYDKGYVTNLLSKKALNVLSGPQPFFLYLPYTAPHGPFQPPPNGRTGRAYHLMLEHLDEWLERIISKAMKMPDTYVFFTSDNGSSRQDSVGKFRGSKRSCYEGGMRVPAFVSGPNVLNQTLDAPFHISDFFATVCELAGCTPGKRDGMSLADHIFSGNISGRHEIVHNISSHHRDQNAIRIGDFKLLVDRDRKEYLFNIREDPYEEKPLVSSMAKKRELRARLKTLESEMMPFQKKKAPKKFPEFWGPLN